MDERYAPLDAVMIFKTLILQTLYGLSDAQIEFQILDRRSFDRFVGLDAGDNAPDQTTIWRFRKALVRADAIDAAFARFDAHLKGLGYLAMGGQIVDASIIAAPRPSPMPCSENMCVSNSPSAMFPTYRGTWSGTAKRKPVDRLSITATGQPASAKARTAWLPI